MPTRSKMTVMGLYNYNDSLFDDMQFPDGIDKQTAIMRILFDNAELEVNLPHFALMKEMIKYWSISNYYKWKTLFETTQLEYNPIWNVDAEESETTERTYESEKAGTFSETGSNESISAGTESVETETDDEERKQASGTNGNTRTLNTQNTADNFGKLAGFNSNTYNNVTNNSGTNTETGTITDAGTTSTGETVTNSGSGTSDKTTSENVTESSRNNGTNSGTENIDETVTITKSRHGNIGVTMTQQLIEKEREVALFSIYEVISNDFKHYFCIMVY